MAKRRLQTHLEVETEAGAVLDSARIRLLEAIDKYGSISQAARRVPMSYKAAWDALDDLNNLADSPVVQRSIGGAGGGGTKLTDYGRKLVAMFRALEGEYQGAMDRLDGAAAAAEPADQKGFQRLLRRISLRTRRAISSPAPSHASRQAVSMRWCSSRWTKTASWRRRSPAIRSSNWICRQARR